MGNKQHSCASDQQVQHPGLAFARKPASPTTRILSTIRIYGFTTAATENTRGIRIPKKLFRIEISINSQVQKILRFPHNYLSNIAGNIPDFAEASQAPDKCRNPWRTTYRPFNCPRVTILSDLPTINRIFFIMSIYASRCNC